MKKYLFSFLLVLSVTFSQPQKELPPFIPIVPFQTEVIAFPRTDGDFSVHYTYKIPYRLLVFERQSESFIANFRIIVEISDQDDQLVDRDIKDNKISVDNFEETTEPDLFLQDYLSFEVKPGDYKVVAIISDRNSTGERPLKPFEIKLDSINEKIVFNPLVVLSQENICNEKNAFVFANSGGNIPFSASEYDLVIPIVDTALTNLDVILENNDEVIYSGKIDESFIQNVGLSKCEEKIIITETTENITTRNFRLKYINKKISEGLLLITIKNEMKDLDEKFELNVVWFNKPFSLMNPETAIELLENVSPESVVDDLLSEDESDYPKELQNYWSKFDPTPETTFNEIMFEYYGRVDYAVKEFASITNNNGAKTDRGKVYIKFGNPDKIDRTSSTQGEVIEVWTYSNPQRKFTFIDKIGTGNFKLTED